MLNLLLILLLAIIIDIFWGEPPTSLHPVVWMGMVIDKLVIPLIKWNNKLSGLVLTALTSLIFIIIFYLLLLLASFSIFLFSTVSIILLSTTFAIKELYQTANEVRNILDGDIDKARELVSYLVSRNTDHLSKSELVSATVESLTENINDSVIAPLFYVLITGMLVTAFLSSDIFTQIFLLTSPHNLNWILTIHNPFTTSWYLFTLLTLPILVGVIYRVINTLDAMVGYDNLKYRLIGWFPAKLDDILNFLPSRITGFLVVISALLCGLDWRNSWRIMKRDGKNTPSPNSGYPMAASAGALKVKLEKPGVYVLGQAENQLDMVIIEKGIFLTKITLGLFIVFSFTIYILLFLIIGNI